MAKHDQSPTLRQQSKKFRAKPLKGPSIEAADFGDECIVRTPCTDNKPVIKKSNVQSSELLSTSDLVSAVGQIWDCASRSLAYVQPRTGPNFSDNINQNGNKIRYLVADDDIVALDVIGRECLHVHLNSCSYFPSIVQRSLECMRMTNKIYYRPCEDHYIQNFSRGIRYDTSANPYTCLKEKSIADVGISYGLPSKHRWLSQINSQGVYPISTSMETMKIIQSFMPGTSASVCFPPFINEGILSSVKDPLSSGTSEDIISRNSSIPLLYSDYFFQVVQSAHHRGYFSNEDKHHQGEADNLVEHEMPQFKGSNIQGEIQSKSSSPVMNKPSLLLAKQEHAVSGALSGIVVSLCLHPIDTVKTVLQSCQAGQKSLCYVGQSIITERGLSGLYRGISSNISTSAPISALYTFTYESVKGFLLPSMAKEYHSVAHCTAGGIASIATSFIFTPSDHIKQQMQVNSKYQNCWNAALRIIEKGGFLSLYSGWGAVLCRNIPHSIIKFYTYESLKQRFISSEMPNNRPRTLQTLFCGGLAGSAAALFSTPFDVVKTRLQTQMPGSARKYQNILNALQQICDQEGVRGLYRGLIPRLVMCMSQGALFFASYEFFQCLLSLDLGHHSPDMFQFKQDSDGDTLQV